MWGPVAQHGLERQAHNPLYVRVRDLSIEGEEKPVGCG